MSDPIEQLGEAAIKATLDESGIKPKIKGFIDGLRNKTAFAVSGVDNFSEVNELSETNEYQIYNKYIKDKKLKAIALAGLFMRKHRDDISILQDTSKRVEKLLPGGKYIAFFIENKFLSKFIIKNTDLNLQDIDISNRIEKLLKDLDSYSFFVSNEHKKSAILDVSDKRSKKSYRLRIYDRLFAKLKPSILDFFVLSASRSAIKIAENVANNLSKNKDIKESYDFKYEKDDEDYFALFNRKTTYPSNT